jgi:hypothetical protein
MIMLRSYANAAAALVLAAAVVGGPALATDPSISIACGDTGAVSLPVRSVLWPPDHKYHPYPIAYSGGAPGDVVTVSATSTDGAGVESGLQEGSVEDGAIGTSVAIGLLADRSPTGVARTYVVSFYVSGSNACGGLALVTMPHDGRPSP